MLDLSKAFDSISHYKLQQKLRELGFENGAVDIVDNFLSERMQRTKANNVYSRFCHVTQGVPQGTILGPLLFNLYVNDLSRAVGNIQIVQYADGTFLFTSGKDPSAITCSLGQAIEKLTVYFQQHELQINVQKSQFIIFNPPSKNHTYGDLSLKIFDERICQVDEVKYLGVYIDKNLSFTSAVSKIMRKMAIAIKSLYIVRNILPQKTTVNLLKTLVVSHVDYAALLLTGLNNTTLLSLDKQIKWGLRAACKNSQSKSSTELKLSCNVLGIYEHIEFRKLTYFHKLIHNKLAAFGRLPFPNYPNKSNSRTHKYILNKKAKSKLLANSFIYSAIRSWNELPHPLRMIKDVHVFKSRLKDHLITKIKQTAHVVSGNVWRDFRIT